MPWFYNNYSGEAAYETGAAALAYEAALHTGTGWHEYATQQQMQQAVQANGWPQPTGSAGQGLANVPGSVAGAAASSISSSILGPLFQKNLWLRIGEVIVGLILLGIGVNGLFKNKPLQIVTNTAGIAGKVVPV